MRALKRPTVQNDNWAHCSVSRFKVSRDQVAKILSAPSPQNELLKLYRERSEQR